MIKRAALARALALDPDLLFLDEPTSGLDPIGAGDFDELIATLQRTLGLTVFMVTHDLDSLYAICDRVAVLGQGRVTAIGTIAELLRSEDPWIRTYFHGKRGAGRETVFRLGAKGGSAMSRAGARGGRKSAMQLADRALGATGNPTRRTRVRRASGSG